MTIGNNKDRHGMRLVGPEDIPKSDSSAENSSLEEKIKILEKKLEEANAKIEKLEKDPVTELFKFNVLEEKLNDSIEKLNFEKKEGKEQRPPIYAVVLMALDLDNLKEWNKYGHPVGDEALRTLANSLRAATKEEDRIFRRGDKSDEIVIVMEIGKDLSDEFIQKQIFERVKSVANNGFIEIGEGENKKKEPVTASVECIIIRPGGLKNVTEILSVVDAKQVKDKNNPENKQERINKARKALGLPLIEEDYSI
ncbi:GGDEF domain-containing protein [Candidatus Nomurabacteria bacterium]|nr:GGDEF domain-containing protein [Candidatus Nomurabacteria bacterium]